MNAQVDRSRSISPEKLLKRAKEVASTPTYGAEFVTDLHAHWQCLYQTPNGKRFVFQHGGAAMAHGLVRWINSDAEAVDWIVRFATDIQGRRYTAEQAAWMLAGQEVDEGEGGSDEPDDPNCG